MTKHTVTFDNAFPIANLVPGNRHPFYRANPRKGGHEIALPDLARSIYEQGVLQPLRVFADEHSEPGQYWVHVGERRLLASQHNIAEHPDAPATVPVAIVDGLTAHEAFQESLTEQLNRLPLHPIDQFEAFADLLKGGMSETQIADHYGISRQVVRQRVALGAIAPKVLKAWRDGTIDEAAAKEFTRLTSHKEQEKLFDRQKKSHGLHAHSIRAVLVPDQGSGARLVDFVGHDLYRERGGEIRVDLFHGIHGISDMALASALAKEKLDAEALRLTSMEGWSWAKPADDMPAVWQSYERSEPKMQLTTEEGKRIADLQLVIDDEERDWETEVRPAEDEIDRIHSAARFRAFTDRQKKKSGCVLSIDQEGRLSIDAGVILPVEEERVGVEAIADGQMHKASLGKPGDPKAEKAEQAVSAPSLSNSQASDLAVTLTEAAALVVAGNFNLAMSVALAAFASNTDGLPARLSHRGMGSDALKLTGSPDFAKNLAAFQKMKPQQREQLFAKVVAASLKLDSHTAERHAMTDEDVAALVNAADPKVMVPAILKRFDHAAYFDRAPKAFALGAIVDVLGKHDFSDSASKADIVAYATDNVPPAKWLPVEVRPAGYDGPGAKKKPAKTPAKPAAKAKAKKKGGR